MTMTTKPIGLYIHIPFCKSKCKYCDFCSFADKIKESGEDYTRALIDEVYTYKKQEKIVVDTIYIGGGTPTLLDTSLLSRILVAVNDVFFVVEGAEITIEANPGTICEETAKEYKKLSINRISLGLQSTNDTELSLLGRIHTYEEFLVSYRMLRRAGFDNINIDLMYGIPDQTKESFLGTLDKVISLSPEHISAYGLIIEPGTPFYTEKCKLKFPNEEEECEMYDLLCDKMREAGYIHYEISNYAKEGCQSRHNLKYWHDEEYIGVGLAAHSYFENRRYSNTVSLLDYIQSKYGSCGEVIDIRDEMFEYAMMRLRLSTGISLSEYKKRFGIDFCKGKDDIIKRFSDMGFISLGEDRLSFTERGFYLSNTLLAELL